VSDDASVMNGWRDACSAAGDVRDRGDGAREPAEAEEEREWVRRCRQGDEAASRELLRRYRLGSLVPTVAADRALDHSLVQTTTDELGS
jgi:hypothetical protein